MLQSTPVFGQELIHIELAEAHLNAAELVEVGSFKDTYCVGRLWVTADRTLFVSLRIRTCGEVQPAYIPLGGLASGPHTLRIRWEADRVVLRLDQQPEVPTAWKEPPAAPQG